MKEIKIPSDWIESKIGDFVVEFKSGASIKRTDFTDSGIKVIPKKAVRYGGKLIMEEEKLQFVSNEFMSSNMSAIADEESLITVFRDLVPSAPSLGLIVRDTNDYEPKIMAQGVCSIKLNTGLEADFLTQYSNSDVYRKRMSQVKVGTTQVHLRNEDFFNTRLLVPPIFEQRKIADILSVIDNHITELNSMVVDLEEVKRGLTENLLLKGIGHTDYKSSVIGRIPSNWDVKRLKELTLKITDGTHKTPKYKENGVPFLRVTDIKQRVINWENTKFVSEKEHIEMCKRCRPDKFDILYSKNGTIGVPKIVDWDNEFSIFVSLCLIKPNHDIIDYMYLSQFLDSTNCKQQIAKRTKQGTVTNLHLEEIRELNIPLPPLKEQKLLSSKVNEVNYLIYQYQDQYDDVVELKKGLMQQLLTGKTRVKIDN